MIIQFVKDEGVRVVCEATGTCRYDTERDLGEWKSLWVMVLCVVKKTKIISYFCVPKSYSFAQFWHMWLLTHLDRKALTFCKLNLIPWTPFLNRKLFSINGYLLPCNDQLSLTGSTKTRFKIHDPYDPSKYSLVSKREQSSGQFNMAEGKQQTNATCANQIDQISVGKAQFVCCLFSFINNDPLPNLIQ